MADTKKKEPFGGKRAAPFGKGGKPKEQTERERKEDRQQEQKRSVRTAKKAAAPKKK